MTAPMAEDQAITGYKPIRIFIIAGEPSGDLLGGRLMAALKRHSSGNVKFAGVGGERMAVEGLNSPFPITDLSVMGLAEILPRIFNLRRKVRQTADAIEQYVPDLLITIDSPGFCFAVLKRLKRTQATKRIHYVAPSVWAWRAGRIYKFAREFDHLLTLLPFEPPYFKPEGLDTTFVGHAVIESEMGVANGTKFRQRFQIEEDIPLLCMLPGSRMGEVQRHLEPFRLALATLKNRFPTLQVVVPTIPAIKDEVSHTVRSWKNNVLVIEGEKDKFDAMAASNIALAASGTVVLELALARVPTVIAYRVNVITSWIVKALIKIPYANLVNILLNREAVPEFIQGKCTGDNLANALKNLLEDKVAYEAQQTAADDAIKLLKMGDLSPSDVAARTILSLIHPS